MEYRKRQKQNLAKLYILDQKLQIVDTFANNGPGLNCHVNCHVYFNVNTSWAIFRIAMLLTMNAAGILTKITWNTKMGHWPMCIVDICVYNSWTFTLVLIISHAGALPKHLYKQDMMESINFVLVTGLKSIRSTQANRTRAKKSSVCFQIIQCYINHLH